MKALIYGAALLTVISIVPVKTQTYFDQLFGENGSTMADLTGVRAFQMPNSSYLFTFYTRNNSTNESRLKLFTLSATGQLIKKDSLLTEIRHLETFDMIRIETGYALCGTYGTYASDTLEFYLMNLSDEGELEWINHFNTGNRYATPLVLYQTPNKHYLIGGSHYGLDEATNIITDTQVFLICTDSLGNELWRRAYGVGNWREKIKSIAPTTDNGYLLAGYRYEPYYGGDFQAMLIKIDSMGHQQWLRSYGTSQWAEAFTAIQQAADGNYILVGSVDKTPAAVHSQGPHWMIKVNASGDILWDKTYMDEQGGNWLDDFVQLPDGSIVASGATTATPNGSQAGYILKTDAGGELLWQHIYDRTTTHIDLFYSINTTLDAGFVLTGFSRRIDSTGSTQDAWILKVDSLGCAAPNCLVVDEVEEVQPLWATAPRVWPNPFSEMLWVEAPVNLGRLRVSLYDGLGRQVMAPQWVAPGTQAMLSTERLAPGLYYLRWENQTGEEQGVVRVVAQKRR